MATQTSIANTLDYAGEEAMLDRNAKKIFSHKAILAPLMRMSIPEFKDCTDAYIIANCFDSEPEVSSFPVHQDEGKKLDGDQRITQMNAEESADSERTVHYDIRFTARVPVSGARISLIINLEIQVDDQLEYQVVTRGIYYCARMISAQYGTVFTKSEYQKVQKVYSIWICPDSRSRQHSITDYRMTERIRLGNLPAKKEDYDKLHVVVITLGPNGTDSTDELVKYLSLILTNEKPLEVRKQQLEEQYRIEMDRGMEEEMSSVCNLGESIARRSRTEGRALGRIEGRKEGRKEGRLEGANLLGELMLKLKELGRTEDAFRAASDQEYREKLYKEFQLA